jgi:hypothetical protein
MQAVEAHETQVLVKSGGVSVTQTMSFPVRGQSSAVTHRKGPPSTWLREVLDEEQG